MDNSWQMILTLACVAAAAAQLVLRVWRVWHNTQTAGSCGGDCHGCPSGSLRDGPDLVQLDLKKM